MYPIYLTESAKKELQEKDLMDLERMSYLQRRYWENGTRVKKLKGINTFLYIKLVLIRPEEYCLHLFLLMKKE